MNQYAWNKEHVESFPLHTEMRKYLFDISIKLFFFFFCLEHNQYWIFGVDANTNITK